MKNFRKITLASAMLVASLGALAQTQSPINNGPGDQSYQVQGDTTASADHTQSQANQIGNSANANGAQVNPTIDTRTQINPTNTSSTSSNALGANLALGNNSDAHASNGPQTMGQANTGNSAIGNTSATTGPSTSSVGNTTAAGGAGGAGGQGGQGGAASSNGTNLGINGQQQGIDRSGNSANNVLGGDQRNAQGQQQAANANGTNTSRNAQNTSAGNGAGAGAGSGNRTALVAEGDKNSYSDNSRVTIIPPVIHGAVLPPLAGTRLDTTTVECGPRVEVWLTPRYVLNKRVLLPDEMVQQGWNQYTKPAKPRFEIEVLNAGTPYEKVMVIGHLKLIGGTVASAAAASSISGLVGNSSGGLAQAGAAGSAQVQDILKDVEALECVMPEPKAPAINFQGYIDPNTERGHKPVPRADRN